MITFFAILGIIWSVVFIVMRVCLFVELQRENNE